ncbi:MAG: hypothetical protein ACTSQP_17540 [Promethearchaeota archaeon]
MGIKDLEKLIERENRLYLFLVVWLLLGYAAMEIFRLIGAPLVGIIIYLPFLAFTLFLFFISFSKKDLKEASIPKIIKLLLISMLLIIPLFFAVIILFVVSILSYIVLTSIFTLYGCYRGSKDIDEKLYLKKGGWFLRGLEFWGGFGLSVILLVFFTFGTASNLIENYGDSPILIVTVAYIAVLIAVIFLAVLGVLGGLRGHLNGWLGMYFIYISIYTLYLVLKVIMGIDNPESGGAESKITTEILLVFFDLGILLYSIGGLIGTQAEVLNKKLKLRPETAFFWLIFSKAAWVFAVNFPYEYLGDVQGGLVFNLIKIGSLLNVITSITVLVLFILLIVIFGIYGMITYGKEKKELKAVRKKMKIALETGERVDVTLTPKKLDLENDGENNNLKNKENN